MKLLSILALIFSLAALGVTFSHHNTSPQTAAAVRESAFDRVMRTGVLRCGYYTFQPMVLRDPNTNQLSGFSIDMMNRIAEKTGLKIEWTEEITFGNWIPALQAGRFDAVCDPMWPDMALGREALFTRPILYAGISPLVRVENTRFDGDITKLNDPGVTFVVQEGDMLLPLTSEVFPKAKQVHLPPNTDPGTMMLNLMNGKADAILLDKNGVYEYNQHNDAKVKMIDPDHPVKAQPFAGFAMLEEDFALREFLDNAQLDLQSTGTIDRLIAKWEAEPGMYLRVAEPYRIAP